MLVLIETSVVPAILRSVSVGSLNQLPQLTVQRVDLILLDFVRLCLSHKEQETLDIGICLDNSGHKVARVG